MAAVPDLIVVLVVPTPMPLHRRAVIAVVVLCSAGCVDGQAPDRGAAPTTDDSVGTVTTSASPSVGPTAFDAAATAQYADEPAVADAAVAALESAAARDDLAALVLRGEDAALVDGITDLQVDATSWDRVGRIATVLGTVEGTAYMVWLVEVDGRWLVSHTTAPAPGQP